MKRIYTLQDPMLMGHIEAVLANHDIACFVKNRHLMGGVGDIPPIEAWPEIWVTHDTDAERALDVIHSLLEAGPEDNAPPWICAECGESIEPQFTECWACAGGNGSFQA